MTSSRGAARAGAGVAALSLALSFVETAALAQTAAASPAGIEITPMFSGRSTTGITVPEGANEAVVRITNHDARPLRGEVRTSARVMWKPTPSRISIAPFTVGAGASVELRVPIFLERQTSMLVDVLDEGGASLSSATFGAAFPPPVALVDVSDPPRAIDFVGNAEVVPLFDLFGSSSRSAAGAHALSVVAPRFDEASGDPILPDTAAAYATADVVLIRSDMLARVEDAEVAALAGFVEGGGTLAISIARPEDLRSPTITAFVGGVATATHVAPETLAELRLPRAPRSAHAGPSDARPLPFAERPAEGTQKVLAGYAGGNLHPSLYGSSAAYGLGEVHLLALDLSDKATMEDPWAAARVVDLSRRAYDRRATMVFRPGDTSNDASSEVRKQLDPNESSRWAIAAAGLLLCVYAVLAGPLNFALATRAGRPLRAIARLPLFAAAAFMMVVGIGVIAKGIHGRARHLTLVEAGAGMSEGVARRYRGFYAPRTEKLTVSATDAGSFVALATVGEEAPSKLVVDRDGMRLVGVDALPWQTIIVREDGRAQIGAGIAVSLEGEDDLAVTNRTGHALRAALVHTPAGRTVYFGHVGDGDRISTRGAPELGGTPAGAAWKTAVATTSHLGHWTMHGLRADLLNDVLSDDAPGLADAWAALSDVAGPAADWFPEGTPVVLAQIDGGEGRRRDGGFDLDRDRLLVRVVGLGGAP